MAFRDNLKSELTYKDIRVKELAHKTGISKHTLDHYLTENGTTPSVEYAIKIANALGVSVEWLVTGKDNAMAENLRPEAAKLIQRIKYLRDDDLDLLDTIIARLERK